MRTSEGTANEFQMVSVCAQDVAQLTEPIGSTSCDLRKSI